MAGGLVLFFYYPYLTVIAIEDLRVEVSEPDIPAHKKGTVNQRNFMQSRAEYFGLLRGIDKDKPTKPAYRQSAIKHMDRHEAERASRPDSAEKAALLASWTPIGPAPIVNGQALGSFGGGAVSVLVLLR